MVNASIDDSALVYVTPEIEKFIRNYKISKDDIYVTIAGTLGLFGTIPDHLDNAQLTENAAKLTTIDFNELDKEYLKYYLNSIFIEEQLYREIGVGGGVPKLALYRIEKLNVKYPSIPAQQRIAKILRTVDGQIEKTEAIIAKYKAIKQGLMQDLFTRGIDVATGKLRPRYQDAPELYKPSPLGMIPKEWDVTSIGLVSEVNREKLPETFLPNADIKYVDIESILETGVIGGYKNFKFKDAPSRARRVVRENDTILSTVRPNLRSFAFINTNYSGCICSTGFAVLSPLENTNPAFLYQYILSEDFMRQVEPFVAGSNYPAINSSDVAIIKIPEVDILEQSLIGSKLTHLDKLIYQEKNNLNKYNKIKKGLMSDLLSGKVRVQVDEEAVC